MSNYYIGTPNNDYALYHHGVKGMRWGVRHDPERTGTGRRSSGSGKKMSTAKKVAVGAACIAAVAGVSYVAVTRGHNKAAAAATKKALRVMRKYSSAKIKKGPGKLTGGTSTRYTQFGAAVKRNRFYSDKAKKIKVQESYFTNPSDDKKRRYEALSDKAYVEANRLLKANNGKAPAMYNKKPINKLRRQKGPKVLRYK